MVKSAPQTASELQSFIFLQNALNNESPLGSSVSKATKVNFQGASVENLQSIQRLISGNSELKIKTIQVLYGKAHHKCNWKDSSYTKRYKRLIAYLAVQEEMTSKKWKRIKAIENTLNLLMESNQEKKNLLKEEIRLNDPFCAGLSSKAEELEMKIADYIDLYIGGKFDKEIQLQKLQDKWSLKDKEFKAYRAASELNVLLEELTRVENDQTFFWIDATPLYVKYQTIVNFILKLTNLCEDLLEDCQGIDSMRGMIKLNEETYLDRFCVFYKVYITNFLNDFLIQNKINEKGKRWLKDSLEYDYFYAMRDMGVFRDRGPIDPDFHPSPPVYPYSKKHMQRYREFFENKFCKRKMKKNISELSQQEREDCNQKFDKWIQKKCPKHMLEMRKAYFETYNLRMVVMLDQLKSDQAFLNYYVGQISTIVTHSIFLKASKFSEYDDQFSAIIHSLVNIFTRLQNPIDASFKERLNSKGYELIGKLEGARGACGQIIVAQRNGKEYAVKKILNNAVEYSTWWNKQGEAVLIGESHPHIIEVVDVIYGHNGIAGIIFPYMKQGDLVDNIAADTSLKIQFLKGSLEALKHLHSKNIVHMDVKPENILIDDSNQAKLIDLGYAIHFQSFITFDQRGTQGYRAPETILSRTLPEHLITKVDMWSFGILTAFCFYPSIVYIDYFLKQIINKTEEKLLQKKMNENEVKIAYCEVYNSIKKYVSDPVALDLILKCLVISPQDRISAAEALQHPLFNP